jgi:hypothetical protein
MITDAQKQRLRILARDVGYTITTNVFQIRVEGEHAYVLANNEEGYNTAIAALIRLKKHRNAANNP